MDADLDRAIAKALTLDSEACFMHGRRFTWEASARQFLEALAGPEDPAPSELRHAA
jgi:hypothetical protein